MIGSAMRNIPTDLMRSFVKAIDGGSFTRAAEMVGRTQSAVSLQIKRLEDVVGARLFQRDARNLELTAQGRTFAQYARRMLALNDEALALMQSPSVSGRVRLGAPSEYTDSLLPHLLGRFAQAHPNVMLEVTSDLSKNLLARQQNGEFDLVVALHDDTHAGGGKSIHTEPLVWFTSADHFGHMQSPLPLVLAPPPCIYRRRMLHQMEQEAKPCRITYLSSSHSAIVAAVRAGLGATAMAHSTLPSEIRLLGNAEGLPSLGYLEVRLPAAESSDALHCLATYIGEHLGQTARSVADHD
ncbi:LysR family transcriptional regulator [Pseudochrobactrum sp. Wa41.01b-1]|uniref:LysR substrate-binding domain-containing protein n=1 Tax=Pseudochrobactrum sp. Wa41.01b-1 TaxID=2864102 RepID=UPI001C687B59|nr:LysR substrate-binding domain-containing protein [Pseudochrobactrum sp. Wa41.01b-1]QYM71734.1 LysR family transcriptional regulator [Pseudochrobactrum sp. Wa41.01b-1]